MTLSVVHTDVAAPGLESLRDKMPEYAKDIRLNLGQVLGEGGAPDLSANQVAGIALASAFATRNQMVIGSIIAHTDATLTDAEKNAARAAASVMAMNNVYYRFLHLVGNPEFKTLPAKLRMSVIGQPGIEKVDFELYSLAISAINGCGMCIEAHTHELIKAGVSPLGIQSTVRIAAVMNAAAQALV